MSEAVDNLLAELSASEQIDPLAARNRIVAVFGQEQEEDDRVRLRIALEAVIGLAIRSQEAQGIDTQPLRNALLADKRILVLQEAMGPDELVDPIEQLRVLDREVAAGRMERDNFYELAAAGAQVLGSPTSRKKEGFFKRLFGSAS